MTFDQTWYSVGTASVSNGSTTVTGQSTNWLSGGIIAGDYFLAAGELVPILTVNSNTSITLTDGWPGTTRATDSYKIIPASDAVRVLTATRAVLSLLTNGNVQALSGLTLAANKGLYATGAGALATHDQSALGRAIQALSGVNGGIIRATGAGTAVMQAILGTVSQAGGVPTGAIVEKGSNANGEYVRFADGTQICWQVWDHVNENWTTASGSLFALATGIVWTFPSSFFTVSTTSVQGSAYRNATIALGCNAGAISVFQALVKPWSATSLASGLNKTVSAIAIGRWF
jgi:hypothetical protein